MKVKSALIAGSFDPFTRGHECLVEEALKLFDKVYIAIGHNVAKRGLLSIENRKRLIEELYSDDNRVEVYVYDTLTTELAQKLGVTALVRGVRNSADFEFERTLASINRRLMPSLHTVVLFTPAEVQDISSSTIRELIHFGHEVDEFMPQGVNIKEYLQRD